MTGHSRWLLILWLCCLSEGLGYATPINGQMMQSHIFSNKEPWKDVSFDAEESLEGKSLAPQFQQTKKNSLKEKSLEPQQQRTKRVFGAILIGTSLVVSAASIGTEIFLKISGCAGPYPELRGNVKKIERLKRSLGIKSRRIDDDYLEVSKVLEFVKQCNYKNNEIWLELKRISELSQELITSIDPDLINRFEEKKNEIKQQVKAKNQTVLSMTYAQLSTEYQSAFDSALGTLMITGNVLGLGIGYLASRGFQAYKVNQIMKTLDTDWGHKLANLKTRTGKTGPVLNDKQMKAYLKKTGVAAYKGQMRTSRMAKFFTGASHVITAIGTGFQIYGIVEKFRGCKKIRDKSREGLREIEKADAQFDKLIKNVHNYRKFVDAKGWKYVKGQITGDKVSGVLKGISELAKNAGKKAKTRDLMNAKDTIDRFILAVPKADYKKTYSLQKQLIVALGAVDFVLSCRLDQVKLKNYVSAGCKNGRDTLHNLYVEGVKNYPKINSSKCRDQSGVPYTSESDIAALVRFDATKQKFQFDCVLNNNRSRSEACQYKYQQYSDAKIAKDKMTWLSESQIHYFTKNCPPRDYLFPKEKSIACNLRKQGMTYASIASTLEIPHLVSKIAALKCPTEPPPTALPPGEQRQVCSFRGLGLTDEIIAKTMKFDLQLTKKVVCPTTAA